MKTKTDIEYLCGAVCPYMRQRACIRDYGHNDSHTDGERSWDAPPMDPRKRGENNESSS